MLLLGHLLLEDLLLEGLEHHFVGLSIELCLQLFPGDGLVGPVPDRVQLLVLLQLIENFSLFFDHVTVSEREVINLFNSFHLQFVVLPLILLILQDLVGLDKGVRLVRLILHLEVALFRHLSPLVLKQVLLVFPFLKFLVQVAVLLLVDLVNDLAEQVVVVGSVELDLLGETVTHFSVDEALEERVGDSVLIYNH